MSERRPAGHLGRIGVAAAVLVTFVILGVSCGGGGGGGSAPKKTSSPPVDPCASEPGCGDEDTEPATTWADGERPNIVFITVDDQTAKFTGAFRPEGPANTPNLEALAARGILFTDGVVQAAQCGPSRNSTVTGRYPHQIGVYSNLDRTFLPSHIRGFPESLQRAGYHTAFFGKAHVTPDTSGIEGPWSARRTLGMKRQFGFDEVHQNQGRMTERRFAILGREALRTGGLWEPGQSIYLDHLYERGLLDAFIEDGEGGPTRLPADDYLDGFVATGVENWLERYDRSEPFFLWINFNSPHTPYDQPRSFHGLYPLNMLPRLVNDSNPKDLPEAMLRYPADAAGVTSFAARRIGHASMVAYLDTQVGRVLKSLEVNEFREKSLIVYYSDHGVMLGDHGLVQKGTLYRQVLNANLVIDLPDTLYPERQSVFRRPVEVLDAVQTALQAADVPASERARYEGVSLLPALTAAVPGQYSRAYAFAQIAGATAVISSRWKYIDHPDQPVLFDRIGDPEELVNVIGNPENASVVALHREALARLYERTGPPMTACDEYPAPRAIELDGTRYLPPPRRWDMGHGEFAGLEHYKDSCDTLWAVFGPGDDAQSWCARLGTVLAGETDVRRFVTHLSQSGGQHALDLAGWPRDGQGRFIAAGDGRRTTLVEFDGSDYVLGTATDPAGFPLCVM